MFDITIYNDNKAILKIESFEFGALENEKEQSKYPELKDHPENVVQIDKVLHS